MDDKEWLPCAELADMRLITEGRLGNGGRPVTEFQARLKAQYDDPKQFDKFMARLERMQARHDDKVIALTQARSTAQPEVVGAGEDEEVGDLLVKLFAEYDPMRELALLSQKSKPGAKPA